jgi:hypothetical protein
VSKKKQPDWVARGIGIAAVVVSVISVLWQVSVHLETNRPHTIFVDTCAKLELLDKRIDQAESYIQLWAEDGSDPEMDLVACEANLAQARSLRDQAESSLMRYQCEQAKEYILQADDLASSVPAYPPPVGQALWMWILLLLAGTLVASMVWLIVLMIRRRSSSDLPPETRA